MPRYKKDLVFVIMSFAPEMAPVYQVIQEECAALGLRAVRGDDPVGGRQIIKEVFRLIGRCEFIIGDLSLERPNVYYELGYAHGIGHPPGDLFLIADERATLHFDIAARRVERYSSPQELRTLLRERFSRLVAESRAEEE